MFFCTFACVLEKTIYKKENKMAFLSFELMLTPIFQVIDLFRDDVPLSYLFLIWSYLLYTKNKYKNRGDT